MTEWFWKLSLVCNFSVFFYFIIINRQKVISDCKINPNRHQVQQDHNKKTWFLAGRKVWLFSAGRFQNLCLESLLKESLMTSYHSISIIVYLIQCPAVWGKNENEFQSRIESIWKKWMWDLKAVFIAQLHY